MKFRLIQELAVDGVPVAVACRELVVSPSGYYEWRGRVTTSHLRSGNSCGTHRTSCRTAMLTRSDYARTKYRRATFSFTCLNVARTGRPIEISSGGTSMMLEVTIGPSSSCT